MAVKEQVNKVLADVTNAPIGTYEYIFAPDNRKSWGIQFIVDGTISIDVMATQRLVIITVVSRCMV